MVRRAKSTRSAVGMGPACGPIPTADVCAVALSEVEGAKA